MEVDKSSLIVSKAGRDKGQLFYVIDTDEQYVMFSVDIGGGHTILAHISGKLRMNFIKILPGDKVTVQMSPYDLTRGRITWRSK